MGDFDFGQFKEIFEYLQDKLNDGGQLTPEEQQAYDLLIGFSQQGTNLTNTADFNSLYTAFQTLADDATKKEFAKLYGEGLFQDPQTGVISFTRPGTVMEQFMRRGQSINDGPAQAALSEGLQEFLNVTSKNSFGAMTNAYAAMTPIRQQNIDAASRAGAIGGAGANRLAGIAGGAIGGGRRGGGGGGEGGGEFPLPPTPEQPSLWDKLLPDLIKLGLGGLLGVGGEYVKGKFRDPAKKSSEEGDSLGRHYREVMNRISDTGELQADESLYRTPLVADDKASYDIDPNAYKYGGAPVPSQDMSNVQDYPIPSPYSPQSGGQMYDYSPSYDPYSWYQPSDMGQYQSSSTDDWWWDGGFSQPDYGSYQTYDDSWMDYSPDSYYTPQESYYPDYSSGGYYDDYGWY